MVRERRGGVVGFEPRWDVQAELQVIACWTRNFVTFVHDHRLEHRIVEVELAGLGGGGEAVRDAYIPEAAEPLMRCKEPAEAPTATLTTLVENRPQLRVRDDLDGDAAHLDRSAMVLVVIDEIVGRIARAVPAMVPPPAL